MKCPYCHAHAHEELARCPECGFALQQVRELFGVAPNLAAGVHDLQAVFTARQIRTLKGRLAEFRRKFPQSSFSVVTADHPSPSLPLAVFAFWLFNMSGLCRNLDKGGDNHDLLLVIEANLGLACLTIGYGLEPFIGQEHLGFIVEQAKSDFENGDLVSVVGKVLEQTHQTLAEICSELNRTYGISTQKIYEDEKRRTGELIQKGEY